MNSISKVQALMSGFLLVLFAAFFVERLLLIPAVILLILQFLVARSELRRDYPEDWLKYTMVFVFFEIAILLLIYGIFTSVLVSLDFGSLTRVFVVMILFMITVVALKYFIGRGYCYGSVLFSAGEWVGVSIKSDLFSKITEADYAVKNPLKLKVKAGDRVKVRTKNSMGKSSLRELAEVIR